MPNDTTIEARAKALLGAEYSRHGAILQMQDVEVCALRAITAAITPQVADEGREGLAYKIWAVAQTGPGDGIEDVVARIVALLPAQPKAGAVDQEAE